MSYEQFKADLVLKIVEIHGRFPSKEEIAGIKELANFVFGEG